MMLASRIETDKGYVMNDQNENKTGKRHNSALAKTYWAANISILIKLLLVWFVVSFGAGIVFVEELNAFTVMGFPVGFWFAQQGSIYVFVVLIFVYAHHMHKVEKIFGISDDDDVDSYDLDNGGAP